MTALAPAARPVAAASRWHRLGAATRRRAGRVEWIVFALAVLVPPLVIVLLGD